MENKGHSTISQTNVYDQDWVNLMKQAKNIGLTPLEMRQILKQLANEEETLLIAKAGEFVTDST